MRPTNSGILPSNVEQATAPEADDEPGRQAVTGSLLLAVVLVALGAIALALPWPLQRPMWIKAEVVFAAWWIVWVAVLTGMLYSGLSLRHQPAYDAESSNDREGWWHGHGGLDGSDGLGDGGILALIAALVLFVGLVFVAWLVLEVLAPLFVPLGYAVVWWMLARVLRSSEHCKGNLLRSVGRGLIWSSAYTLPLAIGVAVLHVVV